MIFVLSWNKPILIRFQYIVKFFLNKACRILPASSVLQRAHIEKGNRGEEEAVLYLAGKGYQIFERNWRAGHKEIDIIAGTGDELVIVEVKLRRFRTGIRLDKIVTYRKQYNLVRAATAYMALNKLKTGIRFDVVFIVGEPGDYHIEHIENAFNAWDL
jgi:putative endonuclease